MVTAGMYGCPQQKPLVPPANYASLERSVKEAWEKLVHHKVQDVYLHQTTQRYRDLIPFSMFNAHFGTSVVVNIPQRYDIDTIIYNPEKNEGTVMMHVVYLEPGMFGQRVFDFSHNEIWVLDNGRWLLNSVPYMEASESICGAKKGT